MKTYSEPNAYEVIQRDVENNFHTIIGKKREDIKNIVIVGAYHGYEIDTLSTNYPNCKVRAFEAHPEHFKALKQRHAATPNVTLINKAVCDINGTIDFFELGNGGGGSGSLLEFQGHKFGHPFTPLEPIKVPCVTLKKELGDIEIDLLWVDVQGAELAVLRGSHLNSVSSLFLEIHTHDFSQEWDKEPYKGQCYKEDLEEHLTYHEIHSIGLDNANGNGQGNSFWIKK